MVLEYGRGYSGAAPWSLVPTVCLLWRTFSVTIISSNDAIAIHFTRQNGDHELSLVHFNL